MIVGVAVAVVVLIAVVVFLAFPGSDDGSSGAAAPNLTTEPPPTIEEATSATLTTPTAVAEATTTTSGSSTSSVSPGNAGNPFVGWWKKMEDGRHVDFRVDAEGGFSFWDSASGLCVNGNVESPQHWAGPTTFKPVGTPTLAASGMSTCQFYGIGHQPGTNILYVFYYDQESDTVEFGANGEQYVRSDSVPGIPSEDTNPFVGSWEGTDGDLTHVEMVIRADGSWHSTDTRSAGCERKGFIYGAWSGEGSGAFELSDTPVFDVTLTTYCHPIGEDKIVHSPEVNFVFTYQISTDTLGLEGADIFYTRLP